MTQKKSQKKIILVIFPHSDVTRNLSANDRQKKFANFLAKLSAFHCHRSYKVPLREVPKGMAQEGNPNIQHLTVCGQIRCTWW